MTKFGLKYKTNKQILKNVITLVKQGQDAEMQKVRELTVIQWKKWSMEMHIKIIILLSF